MTFTMESTTLGVFSDTRTTDLHQDNEETITDFSTRETEVITSDTSTNIHPKSTIIHTTDYESTTDYEPTTVKSSSLKDVTMTSSSANTTATSIVIGKSSLSAGEVAAIVIAVIIVLVIIALLLWFLLKKRKKAPLLRVHYKNRDSYYYQENSLCRDSTLEKSTVTMEMQNPACYDAYLPNGKSSEGLSRPPSLCAHEDALMFTLAQTNNNATLLRKENGEIRAEDPASKLSNGDAHRESIGSPELFTGTDDLLGEIMVTVDSMHHLNAIQRSHSAGDNSESDKQSLTSISVPSDVASSPPKTDPEEVSSTLSDRSRDSPDEVAL